MASRSSTETLPNHPTPAVFKKKKVKVELLQPPPSPEPLKAKSPPLSIEAARRRAIQILHEVKKEMRKFEKMWLSDLDGDPREQWLEFIENTINKTRQEKNVVFSLQNFCVLVLDSLNSDKHEQLITCQENQAIRKLCEQDDNLRHFMKDMKRKLRFAVTEHIVKYCQTFSEEADGFDLPPIQKHEDRMIELKHILDEDFERLEVLDKEMEELSTSITRYVEELDRLEILADDMFCTIKAICATSRKWLIEDEGYEKKIANYISGLEKRRENLKANIKHLRLMKTSTKKQIVRKHHETGKIEQLLTEQVKSISDRRSQEESAQRCYDELGVKLQEKQLEEETLRDQIENNKYTGNSPRILENLCQESVAAHSELKRLELKLEQVNMDISELKTDRERIALDIHTTQCLIDDEKEIESTMRSTLKHQDSDLHFLQTRVERINAELQVLETIKHLREDPQSVKKIDCGTIRARSAGPMTAKLREQLVENIREDLNKLRTGGQTLPGLRSSQSKDIQVFDFGDVDVDGKSKTILDKCIHDWNMVHEAPQEIRRMVNKRRVINFK